MTHALGHSVCLSVCRCLSLSVCLSVPVCRCLSVCLSVSLLLLPNSVRTPQKSQNNTALFRLVCVLGSSLRRKRSIVFCVTCSTCQTGPRSNLLISGKLQALVYDILPPTTALTSYAIGLQKLSAYLRKFFTGAQMAVRWYPNLRLGR